MCIFIEQDQRDKKNHWKVNNKSTIKRIFHSAVCKYYRRKW